MAEDLTKLNFKVKCPYHKDHGKKNEECKLLKAHLQELVQAGHLRELVDTETTKGEEKIDD